MKRIMIIAAITALSTTALASSASNSTTGFYGKISGGATRLASLNNKLKFKSVPFAEVGVGAGVMERVRADITLSHIFNPAVSKSFAENATSTNGNTVTGTAKRKFKFNINSLMLNGYVDLLDISEIKLFIGGGAGIARIKAKATYNFTATDGSGFTNTTSASSKNQIKFAWGAHAGVSTRLAENVQAQLTYSWKHYAKFDTVGLKEQHIKGHHLALGLMFGL